MSRVDLHHRWIVRPSELHTAFPMIRVIGIFIYGSGIPDLWSVFFGNNSISQIILGKKFRRSVGAYIRTQVALQNCYFQHFFEKHKSLYISVYKEVARFNGTGTQ